MNRERGLGVLNKVAKQIPGGKSSMIHDASGLSHDNRLTASFLSNLLAIIAKDPNNFVPLIYSLSQYGKSGTLKTRRAVSSQNVFAKTGSIDGVRTLAGYIYDKNQQMMTFALLQNNVGSASEALTREDQFLNLIVK